MKPTDPTEEQLRPTEEELRSSTAVWNRLGCMRRVPGEEAYLDFCEVLLDEAFNQRAKSIVTWAIDLIPMCSSNTGDEFRVTGIEEFYIENFPPAEGILVKLGESRADRMKPGGVAIELLYLTICNYRPEPLILAGKRLVITGYQISPAARERGAGA